jgi:hypothetical protein
MYAFIEKERQRQETMRERESLYGAGEGGHAVGVEVVLGGAAGDVGLVPLALRVRQVIACRPNIAFVSARV